VTDVIVVGGHNGLVCAAHLARAGLDAAAVVLRRQGARAA
jgi:phytoene dehydrogenase-like protein